MAKFNNEEFFIIEPGALVKGKPLTFNVYLYLKLNERVILCRPNGHPMDDMGQIERMVSKGLRNFHVLKTDLDAYIEYVRGTPFETTRDTVLAGDESPATASHGDEEQPGKEEAPSAPTDAASAPVPTEQTEDQAKPENGAPRKTPPSELDDEARAKALDPNAFQEDEEAPEEFHPNPTAEAMINGLLQEEPKNEKAIEQAKEMIKTILKSSPEGAAVADIVDNPETEHATMVAIYSALFAMGLKKNEQALLQDLIIASLMHDIGLTQVPADVVSIPMLKQTKTQQAAYEPHVELATALLQDLDYVPKKRVMTLIHQHHEKFNGTGYPHHLDSFRIDELSQLISLADFIDSVSRGQYDGAERTLDEALHIVAQIEKQSTFPEYFNPDVFKKVMNWLKNGGGHDYLAAAEAAVNETKQKLMKAG